MLGEKCRCHARRLFIRYSSRNASQYLTGCHYADDGRWRCAGDTQEPTERLMPTILRHYLSRAAEDAAAAMRRAEPRRHVAHSHAIPFHDALAIFQAFPARVHGKAKYAMTRRRHRRARFWQETIIATAKILHYYGFSTPIITTDTTMMSARQHALDARCAHGRWAEVIGRCCHFPLPLPYMAPLTSFRAPPALMIMPYADSELADHRCALPARHSLTAA